MGIVDPIAKIGEIRDLTEEKAEARAVAVRTVRRLERKLKAALEAAASLMKGLPNLGSGRDPMRLARVRAERIDLPIADLPHGQARSEPVLCIASRGELVMAAWVRHGKKVVLETWAAPDDDLVAEDVEHVAECMTYVLEAHLRAQDDASDRFHALRQLALALDSALDGLEGLP